MLVISILFMTITLSLSDIDPEITQCYQSPFNNWTSCNQLKHFLPPSGALFDELCPCQRDFGLRCTRKVLKCGGDIALCITKNPVYDSRSRSYEILRHRIINWSVTDFNSTLALARGLQPPNGNANGAFDALSDSWLRRHHYQAYIRIKNSLEKLHINEATPSCILIQLCHLLGSKDLSQYHRSYVELTGRVKPIYSLWNKEQRVTKEQQEHSFIVDQLSVKTIVGSLTDCYTVRDKLIQKFVVARVTDYIAMPKENGYQAIHVILFGLHAGQFIELQILTRTMDRNQTGRVHSRYKKMQDSLLYE